RLGGAVPVGAQDEGAPVVGVGGDPEAGDHPGPVAVGQGERLAGPDVDARGDLPALSEVAGVPGPGPFGGTSTAADRAVEVLRADRSGPHRAQPRDRRMGARGRRSGLDRWVAHGVPQFLVGPAYRSVAAPPWETITRSVGRSFRACQRSVGRHGRSRRGTATSVHAPIWQALS